MLSKKQMAKNIVVSLLLGFGLLHAEIIKGPYLIYDGVNTEMKVLWQLDSTQSCTVDWGSGSESTSESGAGINEHQHIYTITGLTPGTHYSYLVNCDIDNDVGNGSFYAAPSDNAQDVKFLIYGDTRTNPDKHNLVNAQMINTYGDDGMFQTLTLHSGDWVANADSESDWTNQYFDASYQDMREFQANMPVNGIRGNHEGSGDLYLKYFPYPHKSGGFYWSYDYGPAHIAVVDQYTDYSTGSTQYNWLQNDLASSTKKWKFIILHEPGWSAGGHGNNPDVQDYIQPLAVANNVSMIFAGHNHYYARAVVDGVQHVTTGGGGAPLYTPNPNAENIVVTAEAHHFCELEIMGNSLVFTARDKDGNELDSLQLSQAEDTTPPVITILGDNPLNLQVGDTYTDPGATAQDNVDGDLTASIQTNDDVNTSAAGSYNVTYTVSDTAGNTATASRAVLVSDPPVSHDSIANSDIFVKGTVNGSYVDTHALDGDMEMITERSSGGKPSNRYSYLEHKWIFNVQSGSAVTLFAEVTASASDDGDSFSFAWSTDDVVYNTMFTVDDSSASAQSYSLDPSTSGTVYVRVMDTDRTAGTAQALDTVSIDQIFIRTDKEQGEVPEAPENLMASAISASEISLSWSDNADDEYGFHIERWNGSEFIEIATVNPDVTAYKDSGLSPSTNYRYRVSAYNGAGNSAYSDDAIATTEAGAGITLSIKTSKIRGSYFADLVWNGAASADVDIYRDGNNLTTVTNNIGDSTTYSDSLGKKPAGSYVYKICEAGTENCSNQAAVNF